MKSFIKWIKENERKVMVNIFLLLLLNFLFVFFGRAMLEQGYQKGQLDYQRGIVEWKIEDGQIWHMVSQLK